MLFEPLGIWPLVNSVSGDAVVEAEALQRSAVVAQGAGVEQDLRIECDETQPRKGGVPRLVPSVA